jgi:succinate-acetate transporter protein
VEFQSFIFGQILANFGSFGQFWADFAALTACPNLG